MLASYAWWTQHQASFMRSHVEFIVVEKKNQMHTMIRKRIKWDFLFSVFVFTTTQINNYFVKFQSRDSRICILMFFPNRLTADYFIFTLFFLCQNPLNLIDECSYFIYLHAKVRENHLKLFFFYSKRLSFVMTFVKWDTHYYCK